MQLASKRKPDTRALADAKLPKNRRVTTKAVLRKAPQQQNDESLEEWWQRFRHEAYVRSFTS